MGAKTSKKGEVIPCILFKQVQISQSSHGSHKTTANDGVFMRGTSYSKFENDYYGQLNEIFQLEYLRLAIKSTIVFKCNWFDRTRSVGIKIRGSYNLIGRNHIRRLCTYEPFLLAIHNSSVLSEI